MSYKPYAKYKPSGVEWIGEIPEGWGVLPFRYLFDEVYRYPTYFDIDYVDSGIPEVRGECLADRKIVKLSDQRYISPETNNQYPRTILKKNDIVMSVRGTMGKIGLVGEEFVGANITANLLRLSPIINVNSSFLCWLLTSERYLAELDSESPQTTIKTVTMPRLLALKLSIPSPNEQTKIATFLDRKTTQIDKLIEIKRKQIELLKEERTAIINQAVTKGLNHDAKMKESGIEWIGEIPEGWEIKQLKRVCTLRSGNNIISEQIMDNGPYPVFGGNGLRGYYDQYTHDGAFSLIGRQGALCGNINYASGKFWASEHAVVVSPTTVLATGWLGELLRSMNLNQYSMSAAQPGLSVETIANLWVPCPSLQEQKMIESHLLICEEQFNNAVCLAQQQIQLLQEYRITLISDAVTGKIDIREEAA